MTKPHEKLAKRIQVVWLAATGSDHPRGAYSWFARLADLQPSTVRRWAIGTRQPANFDSPNQYGAEKGRRAMKLLAALEDEYSAEIPEATRRWQRYWAHKPRGKRQTLIRKGR